MAELDDWIEIVRREAGVGIGQLEKKSTLVATSYNSKTHAIKGILQPHGVETGWIPVGTHGIGGSFGILMGPNVGTKEKLDGDQFDIEFENGDPNTPIARHRLFSDKDKPPEVQPGEIFAISKFNTTIKLTKDGQFSVTTNDKDVAGANKNTNPTIGHSATSVQDNKTVNHTSTLDPVKQTLTHQSSVKDQNNKTVTHSTILDLVKQTLTHSSADGSTTLSAVMDLLKKTLTHSTTDGGSNTHSITLDLSKGITESTTAAHSRTAQSITDTASTISHAGNTSVTGTLGVSKLLSALGGAKIGANSFDIDENGVFAATSGGSITNGLVVDTVDVSSETTTSSLSVIDGADIAGGTSMDSLAVFDGADIAGGLTADTVTITLLDFANDAAAATGGIALNQLYRNGSQVMVRVA